MRQGKLSVETIRADESLPIPGMDLLSLQAAATRAKSTMENAGAKDIARGQGRRG